MGKTRLAILALCLLFCSGRVLAEDTSNPIGTWYLNANNIRLTLTITGAAGGPYGGSLVNESGVAEQVDSVDWNAAGHRLEFRRIGSGWWQWYRGTVVESVFVGRFSDAKVPGKPAQLTSYVYHVTGWNGTYLDQDLAPRVYEVVLNNSLHGVLRIDVSPDSASGFAGRLKIYSNSALGDPSRGEELEDDVEITRWDGTRLSFVRRSSSGTQTYAGVVSGRSISGLCAQSGAGGTFAWSGERSRVLNYGLGAPKEAASRAAWQEKTRKQLYHLLMGGNPDAISRNTTVVRANVAPLPATPYPAERDDNPGQNPQNYRLTELQFDYSLPNPYGGAVIARKSHAYLAVPTTPAPQGGKYPAVLALNGHGGSAWKMMDGTNGYYWYGDAWARRGYVVLALDISHRPLADRSTLYTDHTDGDDPAHGNGTHPAVAAAGFDSDWEEDGERVWDAMRAIDYLVAQANVDARRIAATGLSMGGEIATITAALDARVSVSVSSGFSPDLDVVMIHGNHPCWRWLHGDVREYVDASDLQALIASRPMIVETGKADATYSKFSAPFAGDKQVLRRTRVAYGGETGSIIHYLHYDGHHYHVGDVNPTHASERNVRVPEQIAPIQAWSQGWQTDGGTFALRGTLFDFVAFFLQRGAVDAQDTADDGSR